ncbi:outer membrane beta-barrel protein [uncultured Acetobacteroides sp.]|uniref:outer membrane beta-barrel protein n=1 Tax=uncultured Acetobacteroides sp. TaxID=1760811 RepID=UPI0029F53BFD|nr:outer membrane beta-barrel protein [uncultured Acetobacteroides sp.]
MKKILLALAIASATAATAQSQSSSWDVSIGGGVTIPTSKAAEYCETGANVIANATYSITPMLALGGEINYAYLHDKTTTGANIGHTNFVAFLVKGMCTFTQKGIRPYVALNAGWYKAHDDPGELGYAPEVGLRYRSISLGTSYHVATSQGFEYLEISARYTFSL